MASLTKKCRHGRSSWDHCGCQWLIRRRIGGRDTYTPAGTDRVEAERVLARVDLVSHETVGQALDLWLAAKGREPGARVGSLDAYRGRAAHARTYFGKLRVRDLRPDDLTRFAVDLLAEGYAPATVQGVYQTLTASLRHAQRRGVIRTLPLPPDGPGIPTPRPREHRLTLTQVEGVIADMPGVWAKVAELVLLTGLRWGEAVALRAQDVERGVARVRLTQNRRGEVNPPKTRAGMRVVPLSRRAQKILAGLDLPVGGDYREARDNLVAAMGPLHEKGMGWHTIRNAHASLLDLAGVPLRDAAARMGHGHNYAQTLAYGLGVEGGSAGGIDRARRQHGAPSASPSEVARLDEHRARRRRAG